MGGLIAVGLFHPESGAVFGYGAAQLWSQVFGAMVLMGLSLLPSLLLLYPLKRLNLLRVDDEEEKSGLDERVRSSWSEKRAHLQREHAWLAATLSTCGLTPVDAIAALEHIKRLIYRPLAPQASENRLKGEIEDIIEHLNIEVSDTAQFLTFVTHHREASGEIARIFVDRMRMIMETEDAKRLGTVERFGSDGLAFLDASNLKDLTKLLDNVVLSENLVLLLTRQVFKRPKCLAEIVTAHVHKKNIVCVMIDWRDGADPRAFRHPADLDQAIEDWRTYVRTVSGANIKSSDVLPATPSGSEDVSL